MFVVSSILRIFRGILHALPDAAAIGALLSIVLMDREDGPIFALTSRAKLALSIFAVALVILGGSNIIEEYKYQRHVADEAQRHKEKIDSVERRIAFLLAGDHLATEQLQGYFFKANSGDIEEALESMELNGSISSSMYDAMIMGTTNTYVRIREFTLSAH
jgi:hypothetical protein